MQELPYRPVAPAGKTTHLGFNETPPPFTGDGFSEEREQHVPACRLQSALTVWASVAARGYSEGPYVDWLKDNQPIVSFRSE